MKRLALLLLLLLPTSAQAADVTITLSDDDQQKLVALLDLAVKQGGIKAVTAASALIKKLEEAKNAKPAPASGASEN